jgi:hypothetical protein
MKQPKRIKLQHRRPRGTRRFTFSSADKKNPARIIRHGTTLLVEVGTSASQAAKALKRLARAFRPGHNIDFEIIDDIPRLPADYVHQVRDLDLSNARFLFGSAE